MSIEEIKCNGKVKEKKLSSNDGFVTYRRKKRMRTCERDENGGVSANPLVNERFQETRLLTEIYEEGDIDRTDKHWRTVLKEMPQLPVVWEGGGILSSIRGALNSCPPSDNRKSEMTGILGKSKMTDIPTDTVLSKERHKNHCGVPGQSTLLDMDEAGINDQTDEIANQQECQDAFLNILRSEKFVLLSNLLCENFQGIKIDRLFDLNLINSKIENGVYKQSTELFNQDHQQMWGKIQRHVEELVLLASSLSNMSQYIRQKQLSESAPSTIPNQPEPPCIYKVCTCKQCGTPANVKCRLICDECESVYHFSCIEPALQTIPTSSWYCNSCSKERTQSSEPPAKNNTHRDCAVCERLEISETKEPPIATVSRDEPLEPLRTALSRLCKNCGTCEDEDKRFLICGNGQCRSKYYHIRCLKTSQIASLQQRDKNCWYCPSCLCRACFRDQDDSLIVLCDGCDEAYHTYCMKPPRISVPKGQWFCLKCNVKKAKEGMKRYERWVLLQHGKKDNTRRTDETSSRSMDVLLSAVDRLTAEENLKAVKN